eukprot:1182546-Prorocentrum_minimum.AAC.10
MVTHGHLWSLTGAGLRRARSARVRRGGRPRADGKQKGALGVAFGEAPAKDWRESQNSPVVGRQNKGLLPVWQPKTRDTRADWSLRFACV